MRKLALLVVLAGCISLIGCNTPTSPSKGSSGDSGTSVTTPGAGTGGTGTGTGGAGTGGAGTGTGTGGSGAILKSAKAYDANNALIGYVTDVTGYSIGIYSPNGYYYYLSWDGATLSTSVVYFTGPDASGIPFLVGTYAMNGKTLIYDGNNYYSPSNYDTYGNANVDTSISSYYSVRITTTLFSYSSPNPLPSGSYAYPVSVISKATAGIPDTIALPITIKYE